MVWPRRSDPFLEKRITPSNAPMGTEGSVTFCSLVFAPEGWLFRNQTSQYAAPLLLILNPVFCNACAMAGATSGGGAPAGSAVYWPHTASAESKNGATARPISFIFSIVPI